MRYLRTPKKRNQPKNPKLQTKINPTKRTTIAIALSKLPRRRKTKKVKKREYRKMVPKNLSLMVPQRMMAGALKG